MAATLDIPEGFELEQTPETDSDIPEGFTLEDAPAVESDIPEGFDIEAIEPTQTNLEPTTEPTLEQPKGAFSRFLENFSRRRADISLGVQETLTAPAKEEEYSQNPILRSVQALGETGSRIGTAALAIPSYAQAGIASATEELTTPAMKGITETIQGKPLSTEQKAKLEQAGADTADILSMTSFLPFSNKAGALPKKSASELLKQEKTRAQLQDMGIDVSGLGNKGQEFNAANAKVAEALGAPEGVAKLQSDVASLTPTQQKVLEDFTLKTRAINTYTAQDQPDARVPSMLSDIDKRLAKAEPGSDAYKQLQAEKNAILRENKPNIPVNPAKDLLKSIDEDIAAAKLQGDEAQIKLLEAERASISTKRELPEIDSVQFQKAIEEPTMNALELGVPLKTVQDKLVQELTLAKRSPEEIDDIVEAVFAPVRDGNPITAPIPELTPAQAVSVSKKIGRTTRSTKDKHVTAEEMDSILQGKGMQLSLKYNNDLSPLYYISRAFSKKNGNKYGSGDNITADPHLAYMKNYRFQADNAVIPNLVGPEDGSANFIVKVNKYGTPEDDYTIKPLMTIQKEAQDKGLSTEKLNELRLAFNANDDYVDIARDIAQKNDEIIELNAAIKATSDLKQKAKLEIKLDEINSELKDLSSKKTYTQAIDRQGNAIAMPKSKVDAIVADIENIPGGKEYLEDLRKWSQHLVDIRVEAGLLSKTEAEALKKTHPYYLSARREIEDFGFDDLRTYTSTGTASKATQGRKISDTVYNADPVQNTVANMQGVVRAATRNRERQLMVDFFIEKLDPIAFQKVFLEPMEDVMYAIQQAKYNPNAPKVISVGTDSPLTKTGNFQLYYNGKRIDLTLIEPSMIQSLTRPSTYSNKPISALERLGIGTAQMQRNLTTTLNPEFNVKSLVRESFGYALTADARIVGRANLYKFWKSWGMPGKFLKDPKLYKELKESISPGVSNRDYQNIKGDDLVQNVAESKLFYGDRSKKDIALRAIKQNKLVTNLSELAAVSDMATRGRYRLDVQAAMLKQGKSPAEARAIADSAARDLAVNYQERGASEAFNKWAASSSFLKSGINSLVKDYSQMRYKPKQVAEVLTVMTGMSLGLLKHNQSFVDENGRQTYYDIPLFIRSQNYIIKYGPGVNDYAMLPGPFSFVGRVPMLAAEGLDQAFTSMANRNAEEIDKGTEQMLKDNPLGQLSATDYGYLGADLFTGQLSVNNFIPTMAKPIVEAGFNRDFQGKQIESDYLKKLDPEERYVPGKTSKLAIEIGQSLGVSPIQFQYMTEAYTSKAGQLIFEGGDMLISAMQGKEKPQMELSSIPFLDTFSGEGSDADKTDTSSMYSRLSGIMRQRADTAAELKSDSEKGTVPAEKYLDYMKENKELIRAYQGVIEPTNARVKVLYEKINKLQGGGYADDRTSKDETLGDPKLRDKITQLRNQITKEHTKALEYIKKNKDDYGDLWTRRLQVSPQVELGGRLLFDITPDKQESKPEPIKLEPTEDKPNEDTGASFWDNLNPISSAQAADKPQGKQPLRITITPKARQGKESSSLGIKPDFFKRLGLAESSGNPNAKASTSSAKGLYQFTDGTWKAVVKKWGREHGLTLNGRTNPKQQQKAIKLFTEDNRKRLAAKLNAPVSVIDDTATYAAHFLGVDAAARLLRAPFKANASELFPEEAEANKSIFYHPTGKPKTVKEVIAKLEKRITKP